MIVTDDEELASLCRSLRNQGRGEHSQWLDHTRLGYNFRLTEMQAALGLSQLRRLGEFMERRAYVAACYQELLGGCSDLVLPLAFSPEVTGSWFVYVVKLANHFSEAERNCLVRELQAAGIECSTYFPAIHLQPYFAERFGYQRGDFPVTESVASRTIALPFHTRLGREEIEYVAATLEKSLRNFAVRYSAA